MKNAVTRDKIIRATSQLITRDGIRAVRVDEIASWIGISKRTLYEFFADKDELVIECLKVLGEEQQERLRRSIESEHLTPISRTAKLVGAYIDGLYAVECDFLADLGRKIIYAERFEEHRFFWEKELLSNLRICRSEGYLLDSVDPDVLMRLLITSLYELRLRHTPKEELCSFSRFLLRGAATLRAIDCIDRLPA